MKDRKFSLLIRLSKSEKETIEKKTKRENYSTVASFSRKVLLDYCGYVGNGYHEKPENKNQKGQTKNETKKIYA